MILPFWVFLSLFFSISKHFLKYFIFPPLFLNVITKEKLADIWVAMINTVVRAETDVISWSVWRAESRCGSELSPPTSMVLVYLFDVHK